MAIYHLSVKTISRSEGRSATAAAAYRSAAEIVDERTGEIHDYRRKSGVEYTEIVLPSNAPEWANDRAKLWNAAEQSENRKNSTVAREFEIALPAELSKEDRQKLAVDFAREIVERHGVAADIAIHEPSKGGDNRNHHAHILITTRELTTDGFTRKTRELDDRKSGEIDRWRERFAELQNASFKQSGIDETVDHRSLKDQGIEREPTQHLGVAATGYERRTGEPSRRREDAETYAAERLKDTKEMQELEQEIRDLERSIIAISADRKRAKDNKTLEGWEGVIEKARQRIDEENPDLSPEARADLLADKKAAVIENIESGKYPRTPKEQPQPRPADDLKTQYYRQAREEWKANELKRYRLALESVEWKYNELQQGEPKEPKLFGKKDWTQKHEAWTTEREKLKNSIEELTQDVKNIQTGAIDNDKAAQNRWEREAQRRLDKQQENARTRENERLEAENRREAARLQADIDSRPKPPPEVKQEQRSVSGKQQKDQDHDLEW